jgi:hypothetical protein
MKSIHSILIVLNLPIPVPALIVRATSVRDSMVANATTFIKPTPAMPQFSTDIAALTTAEAAAKARTQGAIATRDEKRKVVVSDLHQLKAYVQQLAEASPEHADAIAQAAGMALRKTGAHAKSDLASKQKVSGAVELAARLVKGAKSHEWQYSLDGKVWTNAPPTLQAKTTIGNLQTGVLTYFRHRHVTKAGPGDWSDAISALVS